MNSYKKEEPNKLYFFNKKTPTNKSVMSSKKFSRVKSVHVIKDNNWNDGFNKNKLPEYNSTNDKTFHINLSIRSYTGRRNINNIQNIKYDNSLISPKMNFTNGKSYLKTGSSKITNINYNNDNLKYFSMINLNNINDLWDELGVSKSYRALFYVLYKELNNKDKQEIYQREINELNSIKNYINALTSNIELRLNTIKEISELNDNLNEEIMTSQYNNNNIELIINKISYKIEILRDYTINICISMKQIKNKLNGIKNLEKYDIDIISEKFNFDKNYLIKMKSELNFLKEGYAKFYFNINNDQTPFLLNASEPEDNDKESNFHIVPLKEEKKYDIMECIYYIYQELIAYQKEKFNKNILRRISPLKKMEIKDNNIFKITNGKDESANFNNLNKNNNIRLTKSSSSINNLIIKGNNNENNKIINISQNFIYNKKKMLKLNKNGNNFLLNQFRIKKNFIKENNNISIGLKNNNKLLIQNNFQKKFDTIRKKSIISNNMNEKEKNMNYSSEDDKINENNDKNES